MQSVDKLLPLDAASAPSSNSPVLASSASSYGRAKAAPLAVQRFASTDSLGRDGVAAALQGVEHAPLVGGDAFGKSHPVNGLQGYTTSCHPVRLSAGEKQGFSTQQ